MRYRCQAEAEMADDRFSEYVPVRPTLVVVEDSETEEVEVF